MNTLDSKVLLGRPVSCSAVTKLFFFFSCVKQKRGSRGVEEEEKEKDFSFKNSVCCGKGGARRNFSELFRFQPFYGQSSQGGVPCLV